VKQAELGMPIARLVRQHGDSNQTYFRLRKAYGGLKVHQAKRLRELEAQKTRLKRVVAQLT
jgi:putative transposase